MAFGGGLAISDRRYRLSSRKEKERELADDARVSAKPGKVGKKAPAGATIIARSKKA